MSYKHFYRNIYEENGKYYIRKNGEFYLDCQTLAEALYERDRFEKVGWNWDLFTELNETPNNYIHINLPPFNHKTDYITTYDEAWIVRGRGKKQKYMGTYHDYDEAKKISLIYDATITHRKTKYRVQRRINGRTRYYGQYDTREDAEKRVMELENNGWI